MTDHVLVLDTPHKIEAYRRLVLRSGLRIEILGIQVTNETTCYDAIRTEFGLAGDMIDVLDQYEEILIADGMLPSEKATISEISKKWA